MKIPEAQKLPIRALTETYQKRAPEDGFKDFVQGEGRGINFLLQFVVLTLLEELFLISNNSGPPGVAKTLTAEVLAESSRIPFYIVSISV